MAADISARTVGTTVITVTEKSGLSASCVVTVRDDLSTMMLPANMSKIGEEAFKGTATERVVLPENAQEIPFDGYDYIIDAVDNVSAKLSIIQRAVELSIPVISCMGTGNKLHAERLRIADIADTRTCPLARVMRRELRARGINHVKVLYSEEEPRKSRIAVEADEHSGRIPPGSVSFVPSVAGLLIAGEVIRDLTGENG
jgi:tRNA A37 threonylcarbamoyladenosine dehydratase